MQPDGSEAQPVCCNTGAYVWEVLRVTTQAPMFGNSGDLLDNMIFVHFWKPSCDRLNSRNAIQS